jgi:peptide deformylase
MAEKMKLPFGDSILRKTAKPVAELNPELLETDGEQTGPEACLSFPGYTGYVLLDAHHLSFQGDPR